MNVKPIIFYIINFIYGTERVVKFRNYIVSHYIELKIATLLNSNRERLLLCTWEKNALQNHG